MVELHVAFADTYYGDHVVILSSVTTHLVPALGLHDFSINV